MEQQPSGIPVRTGIPRPTSRVPVLRPAGSQSQLRPSPSAEQLRKKPSLSSIARPSQPTLQKRSSLSSLPRPNQPAPQRKPSRSSLARASTTSTPPTTTNSGASLLPATKRSIPGTTQGRASVADASVFKKPIGRPPSRQARTIPQPPNTANGGADKDVLGDLDAFRSASRASSRASSRAGFLDNEPDHVLEDDPEPAKPAIRKSRPSLSERTIDSLSQLPSSPAGGKARRRSSFFNADTSMGPPARPSSASSNGRRPTTSDGTPQPTPMTPGRGALPSQRGSMTAPGKRSVSAAMSGVSATPSRISSIARPPSTIKKQPLSQIQNLQATPKLRPLSNSKTMVARTPKPRSSLAGTFGGAISPPATTSATTSLSAKREQEANKSPETTKKPFNSSAALREQLAKAKAAKRSDSVAATQDSSPKTNSSQALREQIAKAKEAARRANAARPPRTNTPPRDAILPDPVEIANFDFGLDDPFNQRPQGGQSLLRKRVDSARVDGRLNIAAMSLTEIPSEVLHMYQYDPDANTIAWGEVVDLTAIIAADNDIQTLPETMFPDVDYETAMESEDSVPQFGGIQNLNLHGNVLRELPMGLRRLRQLSKLNLARNKMPAESLGVVFQITSLRELKLAENQLEGALPAEIQKLKQLETLDLQKNRITYLPPEVRALTHLRTLNISDNALTSLPDEVFTSIPLVELNASNNHFSGPFFQVESVPYLQHLQLSNNSLTDLCLSTTVSLPALKHLDLSANRLSTLPDMSTWTNLISLLVGENSLSSLPEGFVELQQLRNADFTANSLNKLDQRVALMDSLQNIILAANPLRERKYLTMDTEDIKRDLLSRLHPDLVGKVSEDAGGIDMATGEEVPAEGNGWKLTPSGTLDLSAQKMVELDEGVVASFAESHDIRQLYLQQNLLTSIPMVAANLSFLSVLDLSKNDISEPLTESLALPKLRELRLGSNKIKSLDGITSKLSAPSLQHLDVSNNRISGSVPMLRDFFPELILFMASDNNIAEVSAGSLKGLRTVSLSNNDIARLEPQIGLLAGTLTSLDVEGNKFRVPNYAVLRKGTDAVLTWLKDKVPSSTNDSFDPGIPAF